MSLAAKVSVLPTAQRALWPDLAPALALGFVLYGGTAIALRLGHRASEDFDFFTERPLDRKKMLNSLPFLSEAERLQDEKETLTVLAPVGGQTVKVSFFGGLHMGRVSSPDTTSDGVLRIASLDDLLAMKLKVILERAEAKDYRDIAALLSGGTSLAHGLGAARKLFGKEFAPAVALRALTYFGEPSLQTISRSERVILSRESACVTAVPDVKVVSKSLSA